MEDGRGLDGILPGVFAPEFESEFRGRHLGKLRHIC